MEKISKRLQEGIELWYDNECCKRKYRVLTKFKNLEILFDYIFFALLVNLFIIMIILTIVRQTVKGNYSPEIVNLGGNWQNTFDLW